MKLRQGSLADSGSALLILVLALFVSNVVLHYPGTMSYDSIFQYEEALSGKFTDWHPPVMAWAWSLLRYLGDGPAPFLLVQLAVYWTGFGLLADAMRRLGHGRVGLLIAFSGAFPPFLYINANVIKDVGMVATWLAAVGLIFWFRSQQRRIPFFWVLAIALLILYGTLVRSNAVFGLGPLLLYALAPPGWLRPTRLIAAAVVAALVAIPVAQIGNRLLFNPTTMHPVHSLFLFDLVGIAAHEGDPAIAAPRATLSADDLDACYTPYWWDSFSPWGPCASRVDRSDGSRVGPPAGFESQWAATIVQHPAAYLIHRLKHFNSSILFAVPLKHNRLAPDFRNDDPAWVPKEVTTERDIYLDIVRKNPFIWPVVWLVSGLFLLLFVSRQARTPATTAAQALVVSALGYSGAYLVIGVATDLRYHYWTMIAVMTAGLLVLPQLLVAWNDRSRLLLSGIATLAIVVAIGLATRAMDFQAFSF